MLFKMQDIFFEEKIEHFTEDTAPDWLTSKYSIRGSTMDARWFFGEHVLTLRVGQSIETDFHIITRIE